MRDTLEAPALDTATVARDFLLDPGFAPHHLLVADRDGVAGYVLAPRHDPVGPPGTGWIAGLGVHPDHRGRGVGMALLTAALAGLRADGCTRIDVADVPVRYVVPGAPAAVAGLFTGRFGFTVVDEVASMGIDLPAGAPDEGVAPCPPGAYPLLRDFLIDGFGPAWWAYFERSLRARLHGDPTPSEVLCHFHDGRPAGVVHYRGDRFGPLAVGPALRGQGVGALLTRAALARMAASGSRRAFFLVAVPAVQPFYAGLGFSVLRRFTRLRLAP